MAQTTRSRRRNGGGSKKQPPKRPSRAATAKKHKNNNYEEHSEEEEEIEMEEEATEEADGEELFKVEKIVGLKIDKNGVPFYKTRWKGYSAADDTWEPTENVASTGHVDRYERQQRQKTLKKSSHGVAVIEYEDGEREMVDLNLEKFRDYRDETDDERDDDTVDGDEDVNNFALLREGEWMEILWPHTNMYFPCKVIAWTPIPVKAKYQRKRKVSTRSSMEEEGSDDSSLNSIKKDLKKPPSKKHKRNQSLDLKDKDEGKELLVEHSAKKDRKKSSSSSSKILKRREVTLSSSTREPKRKTGTDSSVSESNSSFRQSSQKDRKKSASISKRLKSVDESSSTLEPKLKTGTDSSVSESNSSSRHSTQQMHWGGVIDVGEEDGSLSSSMQEETDVYEEEKDEGFQQETGVYEEEKDEHDVEFDNDSILSDDSSSGLSGCSSEPNRPVVRTGHGVPLFDEPEDDFDSSGSDDESESDDEDILISNINQQHQNHMNTGPMLSFEELWTLKLKRTQELMDRNSLVRHSNRGAAA